MNDLIRAELMAQAAQEVWAMLPSALQALLSGPTPDRATAPDERLAITKPGPKAGRVARLPIVGAITRRDSFWQMFFGGGASVERITKALRDVAQDETISTVVLDIDSPGGTVSGLPELAAEIRALRESKHVVALVNPLAASAAYWLAAQADEIVATPEALTGSIGVFALHEDYSGYLEQIGVKQTYVYAGKYKVEGNPAEPLGTEAREHLQSLIDDAYNLFVSDVAKGRNVTAAKVRSDFGEGRVLTAKSALAAGLIDRVAGADETVARLAGRKAEGDGFPAEASGDDDSGVNSQARLALLRRRLQLQQHI